ncbi:mycobactin polyketide synthase MbtD [Mycobacterium montefiorense]|uniref:Polyketide synthase n=1 Tax=Mycobacterium montefiorense TaxID=154654 RepID=A0AA37PR22_9MYCO|nr:mycobactin polyketide synthase MbtD [Mycobacterium montefiorense]GBG39881.1 polyketide synthase [Mycobacterium montefiorense]GKU36556.1 polyketide synthase [Mycobacterium montefiorense]GKU38659.1 polyketide synthase [Mycobacterium montefiorense]GKU46563.1 polyketide synthase [Mycobacterium montefiorense]GKU48830.1 polyketide synthase [Mycobacterium montefiorense]
MLDHVLPDGRVPVLLTSHDKELIHQDAAAILDYLDRTGSTAPDVAAAVASTLLRLRRVRRHRVVLRAADGTELVDGLSALARAEEHPLISWSAKSSAPRIAFVFPGQGNQWQAMGADAYRRLPAYRKSADECVQAFAAAGLPSPLPYLVGEVEQSWSRTEIQGAQFTHAVSLAAAWRDCGVVPEVTIGHSLGEVAAAFVAATITLPDAVTLVGARATVVDRLTGRYAMAVLGVGVEEAESVLADAPGWLEVSAVNGPSSTVVSGDHDAVAAAVQLAGRRGIFNHQLSVDYPGHTSALRPLRTPLIELIPESAFRRGEARFIGSTFGAEVDVDADFSEYWYENLCGTVRFDRAVRHAQKGGIDTFVELSAHPSLLYPLTDIVDDESAVIVGSGHRDKPITDSLSASIAAVATAHPASPWANAIPGDIEAPLRRFPNAPMRAVHLWATPEPLTDTVPVAALTAAVEEWQQLTSPSPANATGCTIGFFGEPVAGALTQQLIDAVAAHGGCQAVPLGEAEIVAVIAPELDQLDALAAIEQIEGRADAGLPDYAAVIGPRCRAVWLLTVGAEQVESDEPNVSPAQAALAAMHRSVGFEFPDQTFGHLDLLSRAVNPETALAIVDVLLSDGAEIALRGTESPRRYVRTFGECGESATNRPLDAAALDNVVITGGSGAIGLQYARYCIEHGARTVTLLSRNGVAPDALARLSENHDAVVQAPLCDITDRAALSAVAAEYGGAGASLLIHTAGIAKAVARADLNGTDVAEVCDAKVRGLALLAEVWPAQPDSRILACSSVFGVWGGYNHAAYAASNRMLDVLAAQLRVSGRDCMAVRWGLWQAAGVVAANEITRTERSGLIAMDPELAIEASLYRYDGDPLIFDADFERLAVFFENQGMPMPFSGPGSSDSSESDNGSAAKPLADVVRAELAATLHLGDSSSIDPGASLIDLGVDSLLALDLRKRLRRTVGSSVPVARMLGGITVHELIDALGVGSTGGPTAPPRLETTAAPIGAQHSTLAMLERLDS